MLDYIHNHPQESERLLGIKYEQARKVIKTSRKTPRQSNNSNNFCNPITTILTEQGFWGFFKL
ncbi:MAG: hypothetical protein F6K23_14110 [Okeania sp. SIO2C9]|uniref:hypothetical protein n=1 Tax=Okeania sp. SIO2C9 TaxID=2607791 RepID=UPI0013BF639D|nr:hypothetical protein [Okeania sp. SIO2C9]NEQ74075.1 hypothetical protein [Okeania sp. SIO2C9]